MGNLVDKLKNSYIDIFVKVDDNDSAGTMTIDCPKAIFCLIYIYVITPCVRYVTID